MVKHLLLVRHAQAEPPTSAQRDFERELTATGIVEACRIGKHLAGLHITPRLLITSSAHRALTTAQLLAEQLGYSPDNIRTEPLLYESSARHLMGVVNQLSEELDQVLIVSHNPTLTYVAEYLTHEEIGTLPTCGSVYIQFESLTWEQVTGDSGKIVWFDYPGKNSDSTTGLA